MIGASKILTVSYGTFSCTLEGFDEPFNTMKAIAEYFRDLAAEDRYFGAEPPTPDAAMLHRIAEREIQRRVEAKIQDNGVILRTGDAMVEPALPALQTQPALADAVVSADSVAARLSKLRGTAAPLTEVAIESYHEDQDADDLIGNIAAADLSGDQTALIGDSIDTQAHAAHSHDAGTDVTAAQTDWQADDLADLDLTDFNLAADVAAAKQIAIDDQPEDFDDFDALDAAAEADSLSELEQFDADLIEDVDQASAKETALNSQAADDALLASLGTLIDPDDQEYLDDDQDLDPEDADLTQDQSTAEPDFAAEMAALVAAPTPATAEDAVEDPPEPGRLQRARARVIKIRRADPPVAAEPAAEPAPVAVAATTAGLLSPEAEAALQAELAALEAELALPLAAETGIDADDLAANLAEVQPEPASARPTRPTRPVRVTSAAVQDVTAPELTTAVPFDIAATPAPEPRKRIESDGADAAVSRLMAQTNTVMDGAEIKRRQSAIAHLKAAVVATEADRQIAPSQPKADRIDPYRSDLESVVRPRRTEAANGDRPQPLVLVSEQRIDRLVATPAPAPVEAAPRVVAPVRPRRIASGGQAVAMQADSLLGLQDDDLEDDAEFDAEAAIAANLFSDAESFGDFAERLGATQLPDMLEAAAVYCAQVLGRPQFSRPMVLSQLATLPEAAVFSREDGLRVFGTLMRQGRITKIKHGQFAVTDRSPILAEAMRTAG